MQRNRFRIVCISGLARKMLLVFGSLQEIHREWGWGGKELMELRSIGY